MSTDTPGKTEAPDVKPVLTSQSDTIPTSHPATTAASATPKTPSQSLVGHSYCFLNPENKWFNCENIYWFI